MYNNMRLILFSLLLSTVFTTATSKPIDEQRARLQASQFLAAKGITLPSRAKVMRAPMSARQTASSKKTGTAPFYVFNGDHGFAIVSGDDRTAPVLGYSLTSTFSWNDASDNLKAWLQGYADQITALQNGDAEVTTNAALPGEGIASKPAIPSMTSALWDQNVPYNNLCPKSPGDYGYTVTGCVATAMAELLYYHWCKTPNLMVKTTQATMPPYETDTAWPNGKRINVSGIQQGAEIDWANMLPAYTSAAYNEVQVKAVANLMLYCGVSVYMDYANGASGANAFHVPNALIKYFGFDTATHTIDHSDYSANEWNRIIYNELAEGRPVFYSGEAGGMSGHAFVIDGYAGDNYFRVNWGWSGAGNDGAYLLSILEPKATGTGAGNAKGGYNQLMRAVISAKPATKDSLQDKTPNIMVQNFDIDGDKLTINFFNGRDDWQEADAGFAYRTTDGGLQVIEMKHFRMGAPQKLYYSPYSFECLLTSLPDGMYDIMPVARTQTDKAWQSLWSDDKYVEVTMKGGHVTGYAIKPAPSIELVDLTLGDIALTGFALPVTFTAKGTSPDGFAQNMYMFASATAEKNFWKAEQLVIVRSGESKYINMTWIPDKAGTYTIWICADREGKEVIGKLTDIKIQQGRGSVSRLLPNFATLMDVSVNSSQKNGRSVDSQGRLVTPVGASNLYGSFTVKLNKGLNSTVSSSLYKYNSSTGTYDFYKAGSSGQLPVGTETPYYGNISFAGLPDGTYLFVVGLGRDRVSDPLAQTGNLYWYNDAYCFTIGQTTAIDVPATALDAMTTIYSLQGMKIATVRQSEVAQYLQSLSHGIYIVNGKKMAR